MKLIPTSWLHLADHTLKLIPTSWLHLAQIRDLSVDTSEMGYTWHRDREDDANKLGYIWKQLERMAQDRGLRRIVVGGLCPRRDEGSYRLIEGVSE